MTINPHRESGTRFGLRQTLDRQAQSLRTLHGWLAWTIREPLGQLRWSGPCASGKFFIKMQDFSSINDPAFLH